jgi:hypothetical protein
MRAASQLVSRQRLQERIDRLDHSSVGFRHLQRLPTELQLPVLVDADQNAVLPDALESRRQDMHRKAADELLGRHPLRRSGRKRRSVSCL